MDIALKVRDVMDKDVVTIDSATSVSAAIKKMLQSNVWSLVVEKRSPWGSSDSEEADWEGGQDFVQGPVEGW